MLKWLVTEIELDLLLFALFYCFCLSYDIEGFLKSFDKGDFGIDGDFYYYFWWTYATEPFGGSCLTYSIGGFIGDFANSFFSYIFVCFG